jgi:dTDP-glucose 4,6-dehydratase
MLVTGGAGFMGSNFVSHVIESHPDIQITVLDALTYAGNLGNLSAVANRIDFVEGSICNSELVTTLVSDNDVVVNFAAESHNDNSLKSPREFYETNVMGTFTLAEAIKSAAARFHHVSTDEVFGDMAVSAAQPFTEDSPYNPSSPYSASKAASDQLVKAWVRSFHLRATISNSANNYGPRQYPEKLIPRSIQLIMSGRNPIVYGSGLNVRDWLHVDDHSRAIMKIITDGILGESYLISAGQLRSNLEILGSINASFGRQVDQLDFVEDRPGHDRKYFSSSEKLSRLTGWKPIEDSIENWIQTNIETLVATQNDSPV